MSFRDYYSSNSAEYARHRPRYPAELFAWLAQQTPSHALAVDIATGNGQAAGGLATHFAKVHAFDASAAQLTAAEPHENIDYDVAPAEAIPLPDHCADLVTVAQALHWLDFDRFYPEARRVLKQDGLLAVWTYNLLTITPDVDALVNHLYKDVVGPWWPAERRHVENGYTDMPFPFTRISTPAFAMHANWNCDHLLGYLRTWSAWKAYTQAGHPDPVNTIEASLRHAFGDGEREVHWPLTLFAGIP